MSVEVGVPLARKRELYYLNAGATWDSTTEMSIACPANTRWKVISIVVKNDVNATTTIYFETAAGVVINQLANQAANTGRTTFPTLVADATQHHGDVIMDPLEEVHVICGVAQGAAAYILMQVLEVPYYG